LSFVFSEKAIGANQTNKTQPLSTFWLEHLLLSSSFRNQTRYFFPILTSASIQEGGKPPPLSATRALAFALFI
jgi:hypothetical protein